MTWETKSAEESYTANEVAARLKAELPSWTLDAGEITRYYKTAGWKGSLMVANTVGHLAEVAFHHPELQLSWGGVGVRLTTHSAKGITHKDFELAKKIESVVMWQPAQEDSALEGTPNDPRYQYVQYEE